MGEGRADRNRNKEAKVCRRADYLELRMLHVLAHHGGARVHFGCVRPRRVSGKRDCSLRIFRTGRIKTARLRLLLGRQRRSADRDEK